MSEWNAMTYEGKDTILRRRADRGRADVRDGRPSGSLERPDRLCRAGRHATSSPTSSTPPRATSGPSTPPAASARSPDPYGLTVMAEKVDEFASTLRDIPQPELMDRLKTDLQKMQEILQPLTPDEWTGFMVTHPYMGPVPAFFYAAGQLMDYGVHSWDIRQGTGRAHGLPGDAADLLVPFMFAIWQGTVKADRSPTRSRSASGSAAATPATTGSRSPTTALTYEPGEIEDLPAFIEFDAGSLVLTAFGRTNAGTVRGDLELAERYLNLFFRI